MSTTSSAVFLGSIASKACGLPMRSVTRRVKCGGIDNGCMARLPRRVSARHFFHDSEAAAADPGATFSKCTHDWTKLGAPVYLRARPPLPATLVLFLRALRPARSMHE